MKNQGFSLIELLLALAIMGLIGAVLIPNYGNVQTKTKNAAVKQVVQSLQTSLESYTASLGHYPLENVGIETLATTLKANGDLKQTPINPFTGTQYTDTDPSGKIDYSISNGVYTLKAMGEGNSSELIRLSNQ